MPLQDLCAVEQVMQVRKGVVANMNKFLLKHPEYFELEDVPNEDPAKQPGKLVRMIVQPPHVAFNPHGTKRKASVAFGKGQQQQQQPRIPDEQAEANRFRILQMSAAFIRDAGGEAPLDSICKDPGIAEARKGVVGSMYKFLSKSGAFELFEAPAGEGGKSTRPMVRVVDGPALEDLLSASSLATPALGPAVQPRLQINPQEAEQRRGELTQYVQQRLMEAGNENGDPSIRLEDLAKDPTVQKLKAGAVSKLSPWLEKQSEVFQLFEAEDENGKLIKVVSLTSAKGENQWLG